MDEIKKRRELTAFNIAQNPTTIIITRTERIQSGGGFDEQVSSKGPFIVRLFQQTTSRAVQDISTVAGSKQTDKSWGLLADYQADLKAGPGVTDEFDAPAGHFKIKTVNPQMVNGQVAGYQCDLEKVI